jgi:hypothetical protein
MEKQIMDARSIVLIMSLNKANGELAELRRTCKVLGLPEWMTEKIERFSRPRKSLIFAGTRRRFL